MNTQIKIANKLIGKDQPCFIVAEMSGNHGQSFERARSIVRAAAATGADAIKMQAYTADTITLQHDGPDFTIPADNSWAAFNTLYELYQQAYTPWEWLPLLFEEARSLGMVPFCSVFDHTSVDYMGSLGADVYKIAAPEITDIPLLRKVGGTGKPVILSSGLANLEDLHLAAKTLSQAGCDDLVILKCTSEYPAPVAQANLQTIRHIKESFGCVSGLSDHTTDTAVPVAAVCLGASVIEKHFTLDESKTVDSFFSLLPEAFTHMVNQIRIAETAIGTVDYTLAGADSGTANGRRSLYACAPIKAGDTFTGSNVCSVRPAHGLHPKYWDKLIGTTAARDIAFGDRLQLADLPASELIGITDE
ncbi:MAG: pseudaminic acid synthase [Pseudomonadota bacterium]